MPIQVQTGQTTQVKKVVIGRPVRTVTSGAFSITNLAGVDLTGVTDGSLLVYNGSTSKFESKVDVDNINTNINGGNF